MSAIRFGSRPYHLHSCADALKSITITGVRVWSSGSPHAGGVGLCEYVQHLAMFDYLSLSCSMEDRVIEYVDHLHEHFLHPVKIRRGHY